MYCTCAAIHTAILNMKKPVPPHFLSISHFCVEGVFPSGAVIRFRLEENLEGEESVVITEFSRPKKKGHGSTRKKRSPSLSIMDGDKLVLNVNARP